MKTFCFLLFFLFCFSFTPSAQLAQFATDGTGNMRDYISWFDWSGETIGNSRSTTFTTADGLKVSIAFSNVTGPVLTPSVMNTWYGSVLWKLYDFTDPAVKPALFSDQTNSQISFTMDITASRGGVLVPFTLVAADAEASSASETTTFVTNGSVWRTIELFKNSNQTSNPLSGCGTQTVRLSQTYGDAAQTGQNPILATDGTGTLKVTTTLSRTEVGGMAVAFGIFAPIDRGDLQSSYKTAHHGLRFTTINPCSYNAPVPAILQDVSLSLGTVAGDADGMQNLNDNLAGVDEDAISTFPIYDGSGSYSLDLNLKNATGSIAYLKGWFDYNRDGSFSTSEAVSVNISNGATSAKLTWTGLPLKLSTGVASDFGFRFRLATSVSEVSSVEGYANDGEVEDYLINGNTIAPNVQATFTVLDTVCVGVPVTIINNSIGTTTYHWSFYVPTCNKSIIANSTIQNPLPVVYNIAGTYFIHLTVDEGLATQSSFCKKIVVLPVPNHLPLRLIEICEGDSIKVGSSTKLATYSWNTGKILDSILIKNSGIYWVEANLKGCINRDSFNLTINPKPSFSILKDTIVCKNQSVTLTTKASGTYTYNWSPRNWLSSYNVQSPIASPSSSIKYFVTATDSKSCNKTDSLIINIKQLSLINKPENKVICKGDSVQLASDGEYDHLWSPATYLSNNAISNPLAFPPVTTQYSLLVRDRICKNDTTFAVEVKVNPRPIVSVRKSNDINCTQQSTQLNASGAEDYTWEPSIWLSDSRVANPVSTTQANMTYRVTGKNVYGCTDIDSIKIDVKYEGEMGLYIPSAFTPNNDGKNDCFGIKKWHLAGKVELLVFTRWGELIFKTRNPLDCWDGTYNGNKLPSGVYIFLLQGKTNCGDIFKKGLFTLIR